MQRNDFYVNQRLVEAVTIVPAERFGRGPILGAMPWLDHSPVRSIRYRPRWHLYLLSLLALVFVTLGFLGTRLPTPVFTLLSQICTLFYFSFFLLMPWWSTMGTFKPVPTRVTFHPH